MCKLQKVFHDLAQLIQIPVHSCRRRLEEVQCESSTRVPVAPDVTAGQWLCSQRGSPEPFCVLTTNISSWSLCGSLLQSVELVCAENCIFVWDNLWLQSESSWHPQSYGLLWSFCSMRHVPLTLSSLAWLCLIT